MAALEGIMTERAADSGSSAGRDYLDILQTILKDNEGFVSDKCEETYSEVIDLANDAIDALAWFTKGNAPAETIIASPVAFFSVHILMPLSNGLFLDMMAGNIPVCF